MNISFYKMTSYNDINNRFKYTGNKNDFVFIPTITRALNITLDVSETYDLCKMLSDSKININPRLAYIKNNESLETGYYLLGYIDKFEFQRNQRFNDEYF